MALVQIYQNWKEPWLGRKYNNKVTISSNSFQSLANHWLQQTVEKFWETEWYRTNHKETSSTFSKDEQRAIQILGMTLSFENNHYSVKTLVEEPSLINNQNLAHTLVLVREKFQMRYVFLSTLIKDTTGNLLKRSLKPWPVSLTIYHTTELRMWKTAENSTKKCSLLFMFINTLHQAQWCEDCESHS